MSHIYEDLVRIRKNLRLSKQDVYYKCRIPMETIESIEDGSILTGKIRNKTYMRSYFRTYAKALGISIDDISLALDEYDAGLYNQGLLIKYLPEQMAPGTVDPEAEPKGSAGKEDAGARDSSESKGQDKGVKGSKRSKESKETDTEERPGPHKSKIITPESQEKTIADVDWEDENIKKVRTTSTTGFSAAEARGEEPPAPVKMPDTPSVEGVDWAAKVKEAVYRPQRNRLLWVILATLLALALALAAITWYWRAGDTDPGAPPAVETWTPDGTTTPGDADAVPESRASDDAPVATDPAPQDITAAAEPESVEDVPTPPPPPTRQEIVAQIAASASTGDTLFIYAYALHGNLEPVRVQADIFAGTDLQDSPPRPYWVEQHQAMRFDFLEEIIFQGSLARMVLLFNGHVIDDLTPFQADGSRVRITRDLLMDNDTFDFAASDPFTDMDPPRSIVDRPRFSP